MPIEAPFTTPWTYTTGSFLTILSSRHLLSKEEQFCLNPDFVSAFFLGSSAGDKQTTPVNDYNDFPPKIVHFGLLPYWRRVPVFAGWLNKYHSITEGFSPIYLLFDLAESCRGGIYFFTISGVFVHSSNLYKNIWKG